MSVTCSRRTILKGLGAGLLLGVGHGMGLSALQPPPTVRIALPALPVTLDPHVLGGVPSRIYARAVFQSLTVLDAAGAIQPELGAAWESNDDGAIVQLVGDVAFHNGEPFDAAAVAFNLARILESDAPEHAALRAILAGVIRADVIDARTVQIVTAAPDSLLLERLSHVFIVAPEHARTDQDRLQYMAYGTGAYRLDDFRPERTLSVVSEIDDVITSIQCAAYDDPTRLIGAIQRREAEIIAGAPPELLASVARIYPVVTAPTRSTLIARFDPAVTPALAIPAVRGALNSALDRAILAEFAFGGYADPASQLSPPRAPGHDPNIAAPAYDESLARELLTEAGVDALSLTIMARSEAEIAAAAFVGAFWEGIGVTVTVLAPDAVTPETPPDVIIETLDAPHLRPPSAAADGLILPLVYPRAPYILAFSVRADADAVTGDGALRVDRLTVMG
jgi:peptide/nickel transport system substrate-binding protein